MLRCMGSQFLAPSSSTASSCSTPAVGTTTGLSARKLDWRTTRVFREYPEGSRRLRLRLTCCVAVADAAQDLEIEGYLNAHPVAAERIPTIAPVTTHQPKIASEQRLPEADRSWAKIIWRKRRDDEESREDRAHHVLAPGYSSASANTSGIARASKTR